MSIFGLYDEVELSTDFEEACSGQRGRIIHTFDRTDMVVVVEFWNSEKILDVPINYLRIIKKASKDEGDLDG
ncbi:hypothetical protein [Silicimonas algicola]|uniref:hypothetical protein n=1 Tax=Silicimonas algicola TaxID=1826607 RepID=UPI000D6B35A7|nr:hypothetical protein [Silicimonas algicola]